MEQLDVLPSYPMCESLLTACSKTQALCYSKQAHAHLAFNGFDSFISMGERLISALAQSGALTDASRIFHALAHRTAASCAALITAHADRGHDEEAFEIYSRMQEEGIELDKDTVVSVMKACSRMSTLDKGRELFIELRAKGWCSDIIVATTLVTVFSKLGNISEAESAFIETIQRDVALWNAMLSAYLRHNDACKALRLYRQLREEFIRPSRRTFLISLQACRMLAQDNILRGRKNAPISMVIGLALHADARKKGYEADVFVGSILLSMYGKFGRIAEAENVFNKLFNIDVVLWNAMLSAYVDHGEASTSLQLYRQMTQEGVVSDDRSIVFALHACCMLAEKEDSSYMEGKAIKAISLEIGRSLHDDARRKGYDRDVYVRSSLVNMYGKCGSITDAESTLGFLYEGDIVPQNAMMSVYIEHGQEKTALQLYRQMQEVGMIPNERTFVIVLQSCCALAEKEECVLVEGRPSRVMSFEIGQALHADARKKGFGSNTFVCTNLVNMYGKCGRIIEAEVMFFAIPQPDIEAQNALLLAYVKQQDAKRALQFYRTMYMHSDQWTFVVALQACHIFAENEEVIEGQSVKPVSLEIVQALHCHARRRGLDLVAFVGSALMHVYAECGNIENIENVFRKLPQRDVVAWNAIISAYVEDDQAEKALQLYKEMQVQGVRPNERTFLYATQACCLLAEREEAVIVNERSIKVLSLNIGQSLHLDVQRRALNLNPFVCSALINMFGKCGSISDAELVFGALLWHDAVPWTAMLSLYVETGQGEKAVHMYRQMQEECVTQDDATFNCILQACNNAGSINLCMEIHFYIAATGCDQSLLLATTLIHAYGGCASMSDARAVLDSLNYSDAVSWNALIAGYSQEGNCLACLQSFEEMQRMGIRPNGVTFLSLLAACSHAGLVEKGIEYFECMMKDPDISPQHGHFVCLVDLLGRAGDFVIVETVLSRFLKQLDESAWLCLLGACQKHGNLELGKRVFDLAVHLKPKDTSAAYVLMSNICGHAELSLSR